MLCATTPRRTADIAARAVAATGVAPNTGAFSFTFSQDIAPGVGTFAIHGVDDLVVATMKFPSGVIAHCGCSFNSSTVRSYRVTCAQGSAQMDPAFDYTTVRRREGVVWKLTYERPPHLLNPRYGSWGDLFTAAIDTIIAEDESNGSADLVSHTWADDNRLLYRHPLSPALPLVGRWLDMPHADMPGDLFTPRMQFGSSGASERMVVSPGRETEGIMEMPTGQSGHPLSPYYRNSHDAWVRGEPTPFLPGPTEHTLTLSP